MQWHCPHICLLNAFCFEELPVCVFVLVYLCFSLCVCVFLFVSSMQFALKNFLFVSMCCMYIFVSLHLCLCVSVFMFVCFLCVCVCFLFNVMAVSTHICLFCLVHFVLKSFLFRFYLFWTTKNKSVTLISFFPQCKRWFSPKSPVCLFARNRSLLILLSFSQIIAAMGQHFYHPALWPPKILTWKTFWARELLDQKLIQTSQK